MIACKPMKRVRLYEPGERVRLTIRPAHRAPTRKGLTFPDLIPTRIAAHNVAAGFFVNGSWESHLRDCRVVPEEVVAHIRETKEKIFALQRQLDAELAE